MIRKLGILSIPVVGGGAFLVTNLLTKSERIPFKKKFSSRPNRVLLDSAGSNHDEVWNAMVQEFKQKWDDSLPFKAGELNIKKLKSYCASLEKRANPSDFKKFERHCSRNNYSSSYSSEAIPRGDSLWEERKKGWDQGNLIPSSLTSADQIEDWCLNKGTSPFVGGDNNDYSYREWCLKEVQAGRA